MLNTIKISVFFMMVHRLIFSESEIEKDAYFFNK